MKLTAKSGSAIAATAAALLVAGAIAVPTATAEEAKGHCVGANGCKGKSACKTATSECAGHNGCKGQGFLQTTKAECEALMKDNDKIKFEPAKS